MEIGAQVSVAGGVANAFDRADELGAGAIQIFALSPRRWQSAAPPDAVLEAFRERAKGARKVRGVFCHASYLINLGTANADLQEKSFRCLVEHMAVATGLGSDGVILHIGSHLGQGFDAVLGPIGETLVRALDEATKLAGEPSAKILVENAAGAGGTIGRDFEELARVIEAAGNDERIGVCLDTQHLFASGISYATDDESDRLVREIDNTVGLGRLACLHLNDSKVDFGSNRDRHENLGQGRIGVDALSRLLSHPELAHAPALLEVPGDGTGPRKEDVAAAKRILQKGLRRRMKR